MHKLVLKNGLLYTSVTLRHEGKSAIVKDVIVDTGAFHTIIAPDYLEAMDVGFLDDDELVKASGYGGTVCYSVRKKIDSIECGNITVKNIKLDFGEIDPNERVNIHIKSPSNDKMKRQSHFSIDKGIFLTPTLRQSLIFSHSIAGGLA